MATAQSPIEVVQHPFVFRLLQVKRTTWLTPHMLRVTLTGDELPGFRSDAADDGIRLYFPPDPTDATWVPQSRDRSSRGRTRRASRPAVSTAAAATTLRPTSSTSTSWCMARVRPRAGRRTRKPGHFLGISGPRRSRMIAGEVDWYLLLGDESGLPAIARRIEQLPAGTPVIAVLEVPNAGEEQLIETDSRPASDLGVSGCAPNELDRLVTAVRDLEFPPGQVFAWAAGEAGEMREVRRHLLNERGIPLERMRVTGYWKRTVSNWDHHTPLDE